MDRNVFFRTTAFVCMLVWLCPVLIFAKTVVKGSVSGSWDVNGSPYIVVDNIYVQAGNRLEIHPGVEILFGQDYFFEIKNDAQLVAKAYAQKEIVFAAENSDEKWGGIRFYKSGNDDVLANVIIQDAHRVDAMFMPDGEAFFFKGVIDIEESSPTLINCTIQENEVENSSLISVWDSSPVFSNCIVTDNQRIISDGDIGPLICCNKSNLTMENVLIYNNDLGHMISDGARSKIYFTNATISGNKFVFGGATRNEGSKYIGFTNCIIYNNKLDLHSLVCSLVDGDRIDIEYTNIDTTIQDYDPAIKGYASVDWLNHPVINWGNGNLCVNPKFLPAEKGIYMLSDESPCVDAGNPEDKYNDYEDGKNPGHALFPGQGTVRNDMGVYGGKCTLGIESIENEYTIIKGSISGKLTKARSPYLADGMVQVESDKKLEIEAGVEIFFNPFSGLDVGESLKGQTQLIAKGTAKEPILFTALNIEDGWAGIQIVNSADDDTLSNVTVSYIKTGLTVDKNGQVNYHCAISIQNSSPVIYNCNFSKNTAYGSLFYFASSTTIISDCVISQNTGESPMFLPLMANVKIERTLIFANEMGHMISNGGKSNVALTNVTVTRNKFNMNPMFGKIEGKKQIEITNSIIADNETDLHSLFCHLFPEEGDKLIIRYSNLDTTMKAHPGYEAAAEWKNNEIIEWGEGTISAGPLFTNAEKFDFTLQKKSPCVDGGDPAILFFDAEDAKNPGVALWPALGTVRNDMGAFGGQSSLFQVSATTAIEPQSETAKIQSYKLFDNYPNPFNPETVIQFQLPESKEVRVEIYNLLGQKVKTLVSAALPVGLHQVVWDATNEQGEMLGSGVYLYRISAGQSQQVKRMILLK